MKTAELTGPALDWAVAKCEGYQPVFTNGSILPVFRKNEDTETTIRKYSTNWSQGVPIIERERMMLEPYNDQWRAHKFTDEPPFVKAFGPTPLIAAVRCYVTSKLGDEVEIPEELQGDPSEPGHPMNERSEY